MRAAVDADFQRVNELTSDAGVRAISEEVAARRDELSERFETLEGAHERAMLLFVDAPQSSTRWSASLRHTTAHPQSGSVERASRVSFRSGTEGTRAFFDCVDRVSKAHGRTGRACQVEDYVRGGKYFYFTYPEDYGAVHLEYVGGALARRVVRPAFEVDFVYCPEDQTLDIHCNGSRKRIADLQQIFGRVILGVDMGPSPFADRVLNLNKLKSREFRFVYGVTTGIRDVTVKRSGSPASGASAPSHHRIRSSSNVTPCTTRWRGRS